MLILSSPVSFLTILWWIILGLIIGLLANVLDPKGVKGGFVSTLVLGILGAFLGGFFANILFGFGTFGMDRRSLTVALIGALVLLVIQRVILRDNDFIKTKIKKLK